MANYDLEAKITADASGYEAGVKKAEKASKKLSTSVSKVIQGLGNNGLVGALGAVGLASQGLTATLGAVVKIARRVSETMNECTNAYKNQLIAERALNTAIENNPFITGASSKALLQFVSDMQKVSNYGDDELIPMMTNLVSLGRTESETMQIMSVAMDMSAGMGISLDSAITQLNATLNGNIGRLGQQNAELKDLTEEELKQGKAIEILGEKFKGLSSATADTSKQLENIKGDFKEALGQFTLPSSDLWNKFWAGFYEKGIEVINKINAFMDAQIIGSKVANIITEQISKIPESNISGRADYVRKAIKALTDEELRALGSYLEGSSGYLDIILDHSRKTREEVIAQEEAVNNIANSLTNKIGKEQFSILRNVGQEMENRRIMVRDAKQEAEDKKKQADAEAQITAEVQKQEEIASKKTDWASKLLDQRIEMLETERDRVMQFAEEEGKETYSIWIDYNNKILELKLERLEKEKEKALEEEGLTAEDKVSIEEYYSGETKKIYNELGNYKKKKKEEEKKDEKSKFAVMVEYAKQYAQKIKQIFSKVVSTIKNIFSSVVNIFSKMFDFNIDDALDNLLKVEDAILTFFVETLPRLPSFMSSVVYSIKTLLKTVKTVLQGIDLKGVITSVLSELSNNLPEMVSDLLDILVLLVDGAVDGLVMWVTNGNGLQVLLDLILKIQTTIEKLVTDNIDKIVTMLEGQIDNIADFIARSMASANRTLPKIIQAILRLIKVLIDVIAKAFENDDFVNSIVESIIGVIDAIITMLPKIITSLVKLIVAIINALVPKLPEIIAGITDKITDALKDTSVIESIINAIVGIIKMIIANMPKIITSIVDLIIAIIDAVIPMLPQILSLLITAIGDILTTDTGGIATSLATSLGNLIKSILKNMFNLDFWTSILSSFGEALGQIIYSAFNNLGSIFGKTSGGTTTGSTAGDVALGFATGGISTLGHAFGWWAKGTNNAPAGLSIVGEAGPELVKFRGGEQVLNNRNTNKALAGMGGKNITNNITFNNLQDTTAFAMMNQFKAYNRQLAINGVI